MEDKLADAKLSLPNIVKPQVACGVADAHSMVMENSQSSLTNIRVSSISLYIYILNLYSVRGLVLWIPPFDAYEEIIMDSMLQL